MIITFGEPGVARTGCGQAGDDWSVVRPIVPGNAVPGLYSINPIGAPHGVARLPGPSPRTRFLPGDAASGDRASPSRGEAPLRPACGPVPVAVQPALGDVLHHAVGDEVPDRLARGDP